MGQGALQRPGVCVTVFGSVAAGLILFYGFGIGGDDPESPSTPQPVAPSSGPTGASSVPEQSEPPETTQEFVEQRPFWTEPPDLFESGFERELGNSAALDFSQSDLVVATPDELAQDPPQYRGKTIFLVGVVKERHALTTGLFNTELRFQGNDADYVAYVGTDEEVVLPGPGDVAYVRGRLAAIGNSKNLSGRHARAAYFVVPQSSIVEWDAPNQVGSANLARAIRQVSTKAQRRRAAGPDALPFL